MKLCCAQLRRPDAVCVVTTVHGHPSGVGDEQLTAIRGAQTGLRLTRFLHDRTTLIHPPSLLRTPPAGLRASENTGNQRSERPTPV